MTFEKPFPEVREIIAVLLIPSAARRDPSKRRQADRTVHDKAAATAE